MVELSFGALSPKLSEQLDSQKVTYSKNSVSHFQKDADAVTRLAERGLLTDSIARNARKKLIKKIAASVDKD